MAVSRFNPRSIVNTDDYVHLIAIEGRGNLEAESHKGGVPLTGAVKRVPIPHLLQEGSHADGNDGQCEGEDCSEAMSSEDDDSRE